MTEQEQKDLLQTVKTFLHDVDEALDRETEEDKLVMTTFMWLQIEALRLLVKKVDND